MKSVGQLLDEIDRRVEDYTAKALNPDRGQWLRDRELERRQELLQLRAFLTEEAA